MQYIHAQDFDDVFIGPFATREEAQSHIDTVIAPRGGMVSCKIIDEQTFAERSIDEAIMTPEEDREYAEED